MLYFHEMLAIISPVHQLFPFFEIMLIIENSSIPLNLFESDFVPVDVQLPVLTAIIHIFVGNVLP